MSEMKFGDVSNESDEVKDGFCEYIKGVDMMCKEILEEEEMKKICRYCGEKKDSVDEYRMCDECNEEVRLCGEVEISIRKLKISDERVEILMLLVGELILR